MYTLPKLPYDYKALEPVIDEETMKIHHDKHHQKYIDKLNDALDGHDDLKEKSVEELLQDFKNLPDEIKNAVRNHGGGHANHSLFWTILQAPSESNGPSGKIADLIDETFGSFADFKTKFTESAAGQFGSGWGWLTVSGGKLEISSTPNQDSPLVAGQTPILGVDVWEHAYYLKYQNKRPDYLENFFQVINWTEVNRRLEEVLA